MGMDFRELKARREQAAFLPEAIGDNLLLAFPSIPGSRAPGPPVSPKPLLPSV